MRSHELDAAHAELAWRFYEATASRHSWGPLQLNRGFFHRRLRRPCPTPSSWWWPSETGSVIAGAFNLHSPTRLYGRYWGCFEEHPFLHFHVCLYHSIDDCIRAERRVFEPGAGGEHKISRGFEPTLIHSNHRIFDPRLEEAVRRACAHEEAEVTRITREAEHIAGLRPWRRLPGA